MDHLRLHGIEVVVKVSETENRVRCMPHIINLSVQDILEKLKIPLNNDVDAYEHWDNMVRLFMQTYNSVSIISMINRMLTQLLH